MKSGLMEINAVIGVWGSLIINNQADIVVNTCPPDLNGAALSNINSHVVDLLTSAGESLSGLTEAVVHYSQKKIFVLDLEQLILVVICTPSVDISLLRMTANVVLTNWQADPKIQKQFKSNFVERL